VDETQDTPRRLTELGVVCVVHSAPFHCAMSWSWPSRPTAVQAVTELQDTANSWLLPSLSISGAIAQRVAFQFSTSAL
jgi:hypothetical protein